MKTYYGNYLGICVYDQDPEFRGRVKIFVPHIMPTLYDNWNQTGKNVTIETVGDNVINGLETPIIDRLKKILPWAECAAPVVGGSTVGSYVPSTGVKNQTGYDAAAYSAVMPTDLQTNLTKEQERDLAQFQSNYERNKSRYEEVSKGLAAKGVGMTPEQVAAIHWREGSGNFGKSIANGQSLSKPARLDGRMGTGGATYTAGTSWEQNAVEVMSHKVGEKRAPNNGSTWDNSTFYTFAERFNGTGYKKKGIASPYVYSGTTTYTGGKYVADGKFDPNVKDRQNGVAVLVSSLQAKQSGSTAQSGVSASPPPNVADAQTIPDPSQSVPEKPKFAATTSDESKGGVENTKPLDTPPISTAPKETAFNVSGADMEGLNSVFRKRLEGMATEFYQKTGKRMTITDGWRSYAVQVKVAREKGIYGVGKGLAARPGTSNHGFGFAADISTKDVNIAKGLGLLSKYGLQTPIVENGSKQGPDPGSGKESWHVEPTGLISSVLAPYKERKQSGYYKGDYFAAALDGNAPPPPAPSDSPAPDELGSSTQLTNEVNTTKNPSPTTVAPTDTSGMPEGLFAIPRPGALLWVFFREGNPLHPVYFAASYGRKEWSAAYGSSSPELHQPNPGDDTARSRTILKNGGLIELTNTNELQGNLNDIGSSKKDFRGAKVSAPSGAHTHWNSKGIITYTPNEYFLQAAGNSYHSCLNNETHTNGDRNDVTLGDHFVVVGTLTREALDAVEQCSEIIKSINEVKAKQ